MKKNIRLLYLKVFILSGMTAFSQKYKNIEDTTKLNKEYINVSNDIVELKSKLNIAENNLPGYQLKAKDANTDAANAATISRDQAEKATNGNVQDAKKAKRKANKAYSEAQDSKSADGKVTDKENAITRYKLEVQKKQHRIGELDIMRSAIYAKISSDSTISKG